MMPQCQPDVSHVVLVVNCLFLQSILEVADALEMCQSSLEKAKEAAREGGRTQVVGGDTHCLIN